MVRRPPQNDRGDNPAGVPAHDAPRDAPCPGGDFTQILSAIEQGNGHAAEQLLPLVYHELRKLAAAKMAQEKPGQTLQATALVHEAYIRLVGSDKAQRWSGRGHFFAAAAEAMRRILVEQARRTAGPTTGGSHQRVEFSTVEPEWQGPQPDLLALDETLARLEVHDPSIPFSC